MPHSRSDNNINIELGATRYFAPRVVEHLFFLFNFCDVQDGDGSRRDDTTIGPSSLEVERGAGGDKAKKGSAPEVEEPGDLLATHPRLTG